MILTLVVISLHSANPIFTSSPITTAKQGSLYEYNITTSDLDSRLLDLTSITLPSWLGLVDPADAIITTLTDHTSSVYDVKVSNDGIVYYTININSYRGLYKLENGIRTKLLNNTQLEEPCFFDIDNNGDIIIADFDGKALKKYDVSSGTYSVFLDVTSKGGEARPLGVATSHDGKIYFSIKYDNSIWRVDSDGTNMVKVAGSGTVGLSPSGTLATAADLQRVGNIAFDSSGTLHFTEYGSSGRVIKVDSNNKIQIVVPSGQMNNGKSITFDKDDNLYVIDHGAEIIKKFDGSNLNNFIGNGSSISSGIGVPVSTASIDQPTGAVFDRSGNFYFTEVNTGTVRKVTYASLQGIPTNSDVGSHNVVLRVADNSGGSVDQSFTINAQNVNDAPVIDTVSPIQTNEGSTTVGTIAVTDIDIGDTKTFSLGGLDSGWLSIDENGTITFNSVPDYENPIDSDSDNNYSISVTVTDGGGLSDTENFQISVEDLYEAGGKRLFTKDTNLSCSVNCGDGNIEVTVGSTDNPTIIEKENNQTLITMSKLDKDGGITHYHMTLEYSGHSIVDLNGTGGNNRITIASKGTDFEIDKNGSLLISTPEKIVGGESCQLNTIVQYNGNNVTATNKIVDVDGNISISTLVMKVSDANVTINENNLLTVVGTTTNGLGNLVRVTGTIGCDGGISTITDLGGNKTFVSHNISGSTVTIEPNGDVDSDGSYTTKEEVVRFQVHIDSDDGTISGNKITTNHSSGVVSTSAFSKLIGSKMSITKEGIKEITATLNDPFKVDVQVTDVVANSHISTTTIDNSLSPQRVTNGEDGIVTTKIPIGESDILVDNNLNGKVAHKVKVAGVTTSAISTYEGSRVIVTPNGVETSYEEFKAITNLSGKTVHKIEKTAYGSGSAKRFVTEATSEIVGSQTTIKEENNETVIITGASVSIDGKLINVEVKGKSDGEAIHKVFFYKGNGEKIESNGNCLVPGGKTTLKNDGRVETKYTDSIGVSGITTQEDGTANSYFLTNGNYNYTVNRETPLEEENNVTIRKNEGDIEILIRTNISKKLVF